MNFGILVAVGGAGTADDAASADVQRGDRWSFRAL